MKVRCIKDTWLIIRNKTFWKKEKSVPTFGPKIGDIVSVKNELWDKGRLFNRLIEWPNGDYGYLSTYFEAIEEQFSQVKFEEIKEKSSVN